MDKPRHQHWKLLLMAPAYDRSGTVGFPTPSALTCEHAGPLTFLRRSSLAFKDNLLVPVCSRPGQDAQVAVMAAIA
jgi:hypothetical protein